MRKKKSEPETPAEPAPDADLKPGTLAGDLRDAMLTQVRGMTEPWAKLSEQCQTDKVALFGLIARDLIRRMISIITAADFPSVQVTIGDWKVGKAPEIKCGFYANEENCVTLVRSGAHGLLVFANADDYFGERAPATVDKDQPDLPLAAEAEPADAEAAALA